MVTYLKLQFLYLYVLFTIKKSFLNKKENEKKLESFVITVERENFQNGTTLYFLFFHYCYVNRTLFRNAKNNSL